VLNNGSADQAQIARKLKPSVNYTQLIGEPAQGLGKWANGCEVALRRIAAQDADTGDTAEHGALVQGRKWFGHGQGSDPEGRERCRKRGRLSRQEAQDPSDRRRGGTCGDCRGNGDCSWQPQEQDPRRLASERRNCPIGVKEPRRRREERRRLRRANRASSRAGARRKRGNQREQQPPFQVPGRGRTRGAHDPVALKGRLSSWQIQRGGARERVMQILGLIPMGIVIGVIARPQGL
jgi:hypothetical protein